MIAKLVTYDFRGLWKKVWIYLTICLVAAIAARILSSFPDNVFLWHLGSITGGIWFGLEIGSLIMFVVLGGEWFYRFFYSDQGYFVQTLPVSRRELYLAAVLSFAALECVFILAILLNVFIRFAGDAGAMDIIRIVDDFLAAAGVSLPWLVFLVTVLIAVELFSIVTVIFAGIVLGQARSSRRKLWSVIWGLILYFGGQLALMGGYLLLNLLSGRNYIAQLSSQVEVSFGGLVLSIPQYIESLPVITTAGIFLQLIVVLFMVFLGTSLFEKGVNLD